MRRAKVRRTTVTSSKFFQGEVMVCSNCGCREQSDPHRSSQWTLVELDGRPIYICPKCFGNDPKYQCPGAL
jgi:hypothetical protein